MKNKVVINANGERILFGKNIITLQNESSSTFYTNNLRALADYLKGQEAVIFANLLEIEVYSILMDVLNPGYNTLPIAKATLGYSEQLLRLRDFNQKPLSLTDFIEFLRSMKRYASLGTLRLIDSLQDLRIKKIIDIQHQTDNRGNFNLHVKADKGANDYQIPETIEFAVPLFSAPDGNNIQINFDLMFTWSFEEANAKLTFKMSNYDFKVEVEHAIQDAVDALLKDQRWLLWKGSLKITQCTDFYKYKESNIEL